MKAVNTIVKILTALAAVAGVVYVIATYGDKIVAWAKKLLGSCKCCNGECDCECTCEGECECTCEGECECKCECEEAPAEEACECECTCACEEAPAAEDAPVAEEKDFEA